MAENLYVRIQPPPPATLAEVLYERVSDRESQIILSDVKAAIVRHGPRLVVDLSRVTFLTSAGLGMLITLRAACNDGGGRLAVSGVHPELLKLLKMTKLERLFDIHKDAQAALKAVS